MSDVILADDVLFSFSTDVILVEDVLSSRVAHYWAPDGAHFCYATFDDTETPSIRYPFYGDKTQVYPDTVEIRYPKVQYPRYPDTLRYKTLHTQIPQGSLFSITIYPKIQNLHKIQYLPYWDTLWYRTLHTQKPYGTVPYIPRYPKVQTLDTRYTKVQNPS